MSIRAMTWAWSITLAPASKLVLMALADIADDQGVCWPSHPTLAAKCCMTGRSVRRVLSLLQAQQFVFVERRYKTDGSQTSNRYRLAVSTPQDNLSGGPRTLVVGGPGHVRPGPLDTSVLRTTTEPSVEPSLPPPAVDGRASLPRGGGHLIYPKTISPRQRAALQNRLAALNHNQAQQVLDELSGRLAIAQLKNPIRYCVALIEAAQHGQFSPELGLKVMDARQAQAAFQAELARIEKTSPIASRSEPRGIPTEFREIFERIRTRTSAPAKKG
jgi:hypothetical protein